MRKGAIAAAAGLILLATPASAQPYSDANLKLDPPSGWTVRQENMNGGTLLLAYTNRSDCYFYGIPTGSADADVMDVRVSTTTLSNEAWASAAGHSALADFFSAPPQVLSSTVDTSGFWPVQRATFQGANGIVHGALQSRPGFELRGFCSGPDASYDAIIGALGHSNDETWEANPEPLPAAPAPTPAPAPAQ